MDDALFSRSLIAVMSAVGMNAMAYILKNVFSAGLLALVVLFQPELRRSLEKMGHSKVSKLPVFSSLTADTADIMAQKWNTAIEAICDACDDLSSTTTGALIDGAGNRGHWRQRQHVRLL